MRVRNIAYLVVLTLIASISTAEEPDPWDLYDQAKSLEKKGKIVEAYLLYAQAAAIDPHDKRYWAHAEALRRRAGILANVTPSSDSGASSPDADTDADDNPPPTIDELVKDRQPQPPVELTGAKPGAKDFDLRGDSKKLWEQVAKEFGLDVVFDGDYAPIQNVRFQVAGVDYRDALYALMAATNTFVVPISERVLLIAKDDPQKRNSAEINVVMEAPIPDPFPLQEAQELGRAIQQAMEIQRFYIDTSHRVAVFRDRVAKARPAQLLFLQLLHRAPQVALDIEFLTTDKNYSATLGLQLPGSFSVSYLGKFFGFQNSLGATVVSSLLVFGGSSTLFGIAPFSGGLFAHKDDASIRTILETHLIALDGTPVSFHVGDKYPLQSSSYTVGQPAGTTTGYIPSFTFEDLGLVLKITPKVHGADDVSLEIDAEFKALGATGENGIPIISNRKFAETVRLKFDECAVISGLLTRTEANTLSGIAGLSSLPGLGPLLSQNTKTRDHGQALLLIQPRLLSVPPSESVPQAIMLGSDTKMRTPL
jgi:general secretion pathway protein D